jgi:hypothetical protein
MRGLRTGAGAVVLLGALSLSAAPALGAKDECPRPTVNALIVAEGAVSRPVIASPAEYGLSNVYSQIEQATKPQFTYAEAGPQYAGVFEALLPVGGPPLVRAVSAYPSGDIPDESSADWGGTSETRVSSISASAASNGGRDLGTGGATAGNGRSWARSTVDCDVVTVVVGWEASDVVLAPGVTAQAMGQTLTLVVGPTDSSADVDTTMVGLTGAQAVPLDGRPTDPFTTPVREGGGPRVEVGEPQTHADAQGATASGGGFNVLLTDPSTGQGGGYRLGSINATITILGALDPNGPSTDPSGDGSDGGPVVAVLPHAPGGSQALPPDAAVTGGLPAVEPLATESFTEAVLSSVTVRSRTWGWLVVFAALLTMLAAAQLTGRRYPGRFPTLAWVVRHGDRLRGRFADVYLRW